MTSSPRTFAFGVVLKELRVAQMLSQEALSFRSGIARQHISRLERGEYSPSLDTIEALCSALDIQFLDMMGRIEQVLQRKPD